MLELSEWSHTGQFAFRGRPAIVQRMGEVFGVALPPGPCRAATQGGRAALWLGPDEWLLVADPAEADMVEAELAALCDHQPASLVDVSHRNGFFLLSGPLAARILNAGCPLDLHPRNFPVGMCTRTVLGKAEIILWLTAPETFWIGVWRSYASYVRDFLVESRRGLG